MWPGVSRQGSFLLVVCLLAWRDSKGTKRGTEESVAGYTLSNRTSKPSSRTTDEIEIVNEPVSQSGWKKRNQGQSELYIDRILESD